MSYIIRNQTPVKLDSNYYSLVNLKSPNDPMNLLSRNISQKLFTNSNTTISYNKNNLTADEITTLFSKCVGNIIDPKSEKLARELLSQTVLNYTNQNMLTVRLMYAQMAAEREKLPAPSATMLYTTKSDIIPSCKNYLAHQGTSDAILASIAYTFKPQVLAFAFEDNNDFENFKTYFDQYYVQPLRQSKKLSSDTLIKCRDLNAEKLTDLTINLRLRQHDNDEQEPYAFARLLVLALYGYAQLSDNRSFAMPMDLGENYNPNALILVNIDRHAHAMPNNINHAWKEINNAVTQPLKMINTKHIMKLMSLNRAKQIMNKSIDNAKTGLLSRTKYLPFAKNRPKPIMTLNKILRIIKHMKDVNQSSNVYKQQKMTYNKPNRRHPDDINIPGKLISTHYKPDIHIYLDTSGSISQENYEAGIKLCIMLAKKLDVNLYFNSFSHYLSKSVQLPLKGRSLASVYAYFEIIPKVGGGTDFSNVWRYINISAKRRKELSLLITDFGDYAPQFNFVHPKNLYYIPIDQSNYDDIRNSAELFLNSMINAGHNIRSQILL